MVGRRGRIETETGSDSTRGMETGGFAQSMCDRNGPHLVSLSPAKGAAFVMRMLASRDTGLKAVNGRRQ
jgi:hypothetical protein